MLWLDRESFIVNKSYTYRNHNKILFQKAKSIKTYLNQQQTTPLLHLRIVQSDSNGHTEIL